MSGSGKLLVIATPVGNLGDISARLKASLQECEFILAEDTRVSIKILNHLNIKKRLISCHDFNEQARVSLINDASRLNQTVALMSDAGTPLISDPGFQIVQTAIDCGMPVIPIPGPSAFLLALIVSGLPCNRFAFEGFLPDKVNAAKQKLEYLRTEDRTMVFYVSPHKLGKTLTLIKQVLGDRQSCLARELTKLHEQVIRGTISELQAVTDNGKVLGECVVVLAGASERVISETLEDKSDEKVIATIQDLLSQGLGVKEISTICSKQFSLKSSIVYQMALACIKKNLEETL